MMIAALMIYIAVVSYIGFLNRKSASGEDYFLASRTMPSWLLAITFIASWWGGGSAVDLADQAYHEGLSTFWIYGVPVLLATALMFILAPAVRRIGTLTQSELFESRYDARSAFMLTVFILIFMTIGVSVQVVVVARFFESFLGFSYEMGAALGVSLVLFYSLFGGFRGVVLTDLFQFLFFLFSSVTLFIFSYQGAGGFEGLINHVESKGLVDYTNFFHNLDDNIAYVITFGMSWIVQANVWQRISAARNSGAARKMMGISFFVFIPLYLMVTLTGMFALPMFESLPQGGIVPALMKQQANPMVSGVIFVGLCSAIMSTMDSMFNTGAMTLTVDIYKRHIHPSASGKRMVMIGRLSTLLMAIVAFFVATNIRSVLTISWISSDFITTGAFVPLIMGFLWRRGTHQAALCSMIFGLVFSSYNFAVSLSAPFPVAWEIASVEQALIGICSSTAIYVLVSLCTSQDKEQTAKTEAFIKKAKG